MPDVWVREFDEAGLLPMDRAIAKVRDEITGVAMQRHQGHSRELSLCLTKLDEARHWAIEYLVNRGASILIPKADVLAAAAAIADADTTDTTDPAGGTDAVH